MVIANDKKGRWWLKKGEEKKKEEEEEEKGEEVKQWCVLEATGKHSCLELRLVLKVKVRNKKNKQWKDDTSLPLPL